MTIEHSTISFGEIHPAANWIVTAGGVASLASIVAGDADIGKVAWVSGVGHYVLAGVAPTVWESLGVTITDLAYDIPSATLSIALSDGTTHSVVIVAGLSEAEVNDLISSALSSYNDYIQTYISDSITSALGALTTAVIPDSANKRYVTDAQLAVLAATSGSNTGDETQASILGKLPDVITGGAYGDSANYPIVTVNDKGFVTGITLKPVAAGTVTVAVSSGTAALAAGVNYLVLVSGTCTLDVSALTGFVDLVNVSTGAYTVNFTVGAKVLTDVTGSVVSSVTFPAFSRSALVPNPNVANSLRYFKSSQVASTDVTWGAGTSNSAANRLTFSLPTVTAFRTITLPDANINFGDLSSVATTNSNSLSGTRNRILGGSSNIISGTDNVAVGCTGATASSSTGQLLLGVRGTAVPIDWPTVGISGGILNNASPQTSQLTEVRTALRADNIGSTPVVLTTDGAAPTAANTPKAAMVYATDSHGGANHILELQIFCIDTSILFTPQGNVARTHRISVFLNGGTYTVAIDAGSSTVAGTGYTISVTAAEVSGRLQISLSHSSGAGKFLRVKALLRSHYNYIQ